MYKVEKRITNLDMTNHITINNTKGQEVPTITKEEVILENISRDTNIKLQKGRQKLMCR